MGTTVDSRLLQGGLKTPPILDEFEAEGGFWRVARKEVAPQEGNPSGRDLVDDLDNRGVAGGQQRVVPFRIDGQIVELLDHAKQQFLVFAGRCYGSEHVILIASSVCSQTGHVSFKPDQEVQFVGTPHPIPRVVALVFLTTCFKGKRKACPVAKLEGQVGMSEAFERVKMVHHEPNMLQIISVNFDVLHPVFIAVSGGAPGKITNHVEGDF